MKDRNVDCLWKMGRSSFYKSIESLREYCLDELQAFEGAFAAISYPFAWNNPVLGWEFCENVKYVIEETKDTSPRLKKWELCELVLDRCEKSWSEIGTYSNVGLPYHPSDFNDHIKRLFEEEKR